MNGDLIRQMLATATTDAERYDAFHSLSQDAHVAWCRAATGNELRTMRASMYAVWAPSGGPVGGLPPAFLFAKGEARR